MIPPRLLLLPLSRLRLYAAVIILTLQSLVTSYDKQQCQVDGWGWGNFFVRNIFAYKTMADHCHQQTLPQPDLNAKNLAQSFTFSIYANHQVNENFFTGSSQEYTCTWMKSCRPHRIRPIIKLIIVMCIIRGIPCN